MNLRLKHLVAATALLGMTVFAVPASPALAAGEQFSAALFEGSCTRLATDDVVKELGTLVTEGNETHWWDRLLRNPDRPEENVGATEEKDLDVDKHFPTHFQAVDTKLPGMTLGDLTKREHAVAIIETEPKGTSVAACGDITGREKKGTLRFDLEEVDTSGFEGRAWLGSTEDTHELEITVGVWTAGEVLTPEATSAASPAP